MGARLEINERRKWWGKVGKELEGMEEEEEDGVERGELER